MEKSARHIPPLEISEFDTPDLRVSHAAKVLQTSQSHIYSQIRSGRLKAYRLGAGSIRIHKKDLQAFIQKSALPIKEV